MSTKTKSAHTPGPWRVFEKCRAFEGDPTVVVSDHIDDAIICSMGGDVPNPESNAHLIAAAPEMLQQLEYELEELDGWLRDEDILDDTKESMLIREDKIKKVIQKAKGEL